MKREAGSARARKAGAFARQRADVGNSFLVLGNGKPVYWSVRPEPDSWRLEELVRRLWNSGERLDLWGFHVARAVALADGEYHSDAHFYSAPDCSTKVSLDTLRAVQEHPERFALVFVDLHN